jgi:adenylate cyclase
MVAPRLATRVIDRRDKVPAERVVYRDTGFAAIAHIEGDASYDPRTRPWYKEIGAESTVYWSGVYRFGKSGEPGVTVSMPVFDAAGNLEAVVGLDITLQTLSRFLSRQQTAGKGTAVIVGSGERLVAYSNLLSIRSPTAKGAEALLPSVADLEYRPLEDAYRRYSRMSPNGQPVIFASKTEGEHYLARVTDLDLGFPSHWQLLTLVSEDDLLLSARRIFSESIVLSLIILLVAGAIALTLTTRFFRPIRTLARNTLMIRELRLEEVVPVKSWFGEVATMDKAVRNLKEALETFRKYVPDEVMQRIVKSGADMRLEGELADITLFCSDTTGFPELCHSRAPQEIVEVLARHLDAFTDAIAREKGTIDKFMGDTIIAFGARPWSATMARSGPAVQPCAAGMPTRLSAAS